jgi:NOL1/NOP2/sun family putative RNA methylase
MGLNNESHSGRRKDPDPVFLAAQLELLLAHSERLLADPAERVQFRRIAVTPQPWALRLNPLSAAAARLRPLLAQRGRAMPWSAETFALVGPDPRLGHTLEYALGAYYVQAAATTLAVAALDPQPGERVLDLCAAPGGKATQIAAAMQGQGLLVINELQRRRFPSLIGQLERCGVHHEVVTKAPGPVLARYFHNYFDRVLLDAPCSGDGVVRKDQQLLAYWSPADARRQADTQLGLLRAAFHMLRPGGVLVYSTCSLSLEENEDVLLRLLRQEPEAVDLLPVPQVDSPPLPSELAQAYPPALGLCARVWPHRYDSEGAFVARLRKRRPTTWPATAKDHGAMTADAAPPVEAATASAEAEAADTRAPARSGAAAAAWLRQRWGLTLPDQPGQTLVLRGKYLSLEPTAAESLRDSLPCFVRAGMRVGRPHGGSILLSQQAMLLWGHRMSGSRLALDWDQVRGLFRGDALPLPTPRPPHEELICTFEDLVVCRGQVSLDGNQLVGMVPHSHRRPELARLG